MKKKLIIICSISALVIAGIVVGVVLLLNSNKSGITNPNPNPTINPDVKTFTITFDSDGGSKVDNIKVECGKELLLPTNPTKEGYTFVSWVDKNETPILDKALLSCEDITLKANWKKEETKTDTKKEETKTETKKDETKTETKKEETKQKSYKCPSGYKLNGTKCTTTTSATEECPSGYSWSDKVKKCVAQTTATSGCPEGYTWSSSRNICYASVPFTQCLEGGKYDEYYGYCFYEIFERNELGANVENCEAAGYYSYYDFYCARRRSESYTCPSGYHHTVGLYYGKDQKLPICSKTSDKEVTCPSGYKLYHSDPNFGIGDRCVKLSEKEKICSSGYTLSGSDCVKTIDATLE